MKQSLKSRYAVYAAAAACVLGMTFLQPIPVGAEELSGEYYEETYDQTEWTTEQEEETSEAVTEAVTARTGTYTIEDGWSIDDASSTQEKTVYRRSDAQGADYMSTITCSYLDTNYSVFEYEQLRDMLTNNLLYTNVNAQISTSAIYTDAKDYLYIILVDDTAQDYRDTYCYVVGDYRCFCVAIQEYRDEAEQLSAQEQKTPQEVGQTVAEKFVWN
jgi:hypothetical protein